MVNFEEAYSISNHLYWKEKSNGYVYLYNSYSKTGCYITKKEFILLNALDGSKNYYKLREYDITALSEKGYSLFIKKLISLNLLKDYEAKHKNTFLRYKIKLFNPNQWLEKHISSLYILFLCACIASFPILIIGLSLVDIGQYMVFLKEIINVRSSIIMYIISFIFLTLHELSHGLVAKKRGAEVVEIGLMLYVFIPFVYITIGGTKELTKRDKLFISSAGVLMNLFCLGILLLISGGFGCYNNIYLAIGVLSNIGQILVNANPFLQVDSYYMLESILGIEDLHHTSICKKEECKTEEQLMRRLYVFFNKANTIILAVGSLVILFMYFKENILR